MKELCGMDSHTMRNMRKEGTTLQMTKEINHLVGGV